MNWIHLVQDIDKWLALNNTITTLRFSKIQDRISYNLRAHFIELCDCARKL